MSETLERPRAFSLDEARFRAAAPYALEPTHLAGVFATPAPARGFDPSTASSSDLIRAGLLWKRPDAASPAAFHATWNRLMSRGWRPEDRIQPQFAVRTGKTHHLGVPPAMRADGSHNGRICAGSAEGAGTWTGVIGYWRIPTAGKCVQPSDDKDGWNSSSWIGIDGLTDARDALQAGIERRIDAQCKVSYVAWYAWFAPPKSNSPGYIWQTDITNFPINPGQQIFCSVQYINRNTAGYIYFANEDARQHVSITLAPPPGASLNGLNVAWIMEAADGGEVPVLSPVGFISAFGVRGKRHSNRPEFRRHFSQFSAAEMPLPGAPGTNAAAMSLVG